MSISQTHTRYIGCDIKPEDGFWLTGKDYNDCLTQLKKYHEEHPEKWIYFFDCGMKPGKPIPVAEQTFEVAIRDGEPLSMFLYELYAEGTNHTSQNFEDVSKFLTNMAMLGSTI